jgi:hypothetical protein
VRGLAIETAVVARFIPVNLTARLPMRIFLGCVLLLGVAACEEPQVSNAGGRNLVVCDAGDATYRRPGLCFNGNDVTDRSNRDTTQNVTRPVLDNAVDITDRSLRDTTQAVTRPVLDNTADVTDRAIRDNTQNVARITVDNTADVTDRRNRDDTADRSVWCPPGTR